MHFGSQRRPWRAPGDLRRGRAAARRSRDYRLASGVERIRVGTGRRCSRGHRSAWCGSTRHWQRSWSGRESARPVAGGGAHPGRSDREGLLVRQRARRSLRTSAGGERRHSGERPVRRASSLSGVLARLRYPKEKLEILVVDDGSRDDTPTWRDPWAPGIPRGAGPGRRGENRAPLRRAGDPGLHRFGLHRLPGGWPSWSSPSLTPGIPW